MLGGTGPFFPVEYSFKPLEEGNKPHFPLWLADMKRERKAINPKGRVRNCPVFRSLVLLLLGESPTPETSGYGAYLRLRLGLDNREPPFFLLASKATAVCLPGEKQEYGESLWGRCTEKA